MPKRTSANYTRRPSSSTPRFSFPFYIHTYITKFQFLQAMLTRYYAEIWSLRGRMPSIRTYIRTPQIIKIIAYIHRTQFIIYHSQITTDWRYTEYSYTRNAHFETIQSAVTVQIVTNHDHDKPWPWQSKNTHLARAQTIKVSKAHNI